MRIVCDFETLIDEPTRVYAWTIYIVETKRYFQGTDIDSFLEKIMEYPKSDIFFHNAKFDGSFIIDRLLKQGFKSNTSVVPKYKKYVIGDFNNFTFYWDDGCYINVIDTMELLSGSLKEFGKQVGLIKGNTQELAMYTNDEFRTITEQDYKKAMDYCKLDVEILKTVMEEFKYYHLIQMAPTKASLAYKGLTQKINKAEGKGLYADSYLFYPKNKLLPIKKITKSVVLDWDFVKYEVKNTKKIKFMIKEKWESLNSQTLRNYRYITELRDKRKVNVVTDIANGLAKEYIETMSGYMIALEPYTLYDIGENYFRFSQKNWDKAKMQKDALSKINVLAKSGYKGGITYVNPKYQNKDIEQNVYIYDINSMYPYIYGNKPIPNSIAYRLVKNLNKDDLGIVMIKRLKAKLKDGLFPMIKLATKEKKHPIYKTENISKYLPDLDIRQLFTLNNIDYQYLLECYDIYEIEIDKMYRFYRNLELEKKFSKYVKYWYEVKNKSKDNPPLKYFAKLMLNALYGKFGQFESPYKKYEYRLEDNKVVREITLNYEDSKFDADVLVASYITSYGRDMIARTVNEIGMDNFVYCDTDSLHLLIDAKGKIPVGDKLGEYKLENISTSSKYIQPKLYGNTIDGKWVTKAAGFTKDIKREDFKPGMQIKDKRTKIVDGGSIIEDTYLTVGADLIEFSPVTDLFAF